MITEERLGFGVQMADWQDRINMERMRNERAARTRAALKENGYPVILLSDGDNRRYATSVDVGQWGMIFGSVGMSIVFAERPDDSINWDSEGNAQRQTLHHVKWLKPENIRTWRTTLRSMTGEMAAFLIKKNAEEVYQILKEKGVTKEKIAYDVIDPIIKGELEAKGIKLFAEREMMMDVRAIKTPDEINCLKMCGYIANQGYWEIYKHLRPGITENELASHVAAAFMRMGTRNLTLVMMRSGPNTAPNNLGRSPTDRMIEPGDLFYCDMTGPVFSGYRVCIYRSFKVGRLPTQKEKDMYKRVYDMIYRATNMVKPGVTTADIAKVWPEASYWGYKEESKIIVNAVGHGLGLTQYDRPTIQRGISFDFPEEIKKGMVFALETYEGEDFVGGIRLENVVAVTDDGCENLYTWPDEEIMVPEHSLLIR